MDPQHNRIMLSDLVKMDFPRSVFDEVVATIGRVRMDFDFPWLEKVFRDVVLLYNGDYQGYRRCTTRYHDLKHTTDVFLAMARLIHGAHVAGVSFRREQVVLALIAALLHDSGYIQQTGDESGTGAKYTLVSVERSIRFLQEYFAGNGYDSASFEVCREIVRCTGQYEKIRDMRFSGRGVEILGKMLGTADLLGQLADRTCLEKLLFLFQEVSEVQILGYRNELDLMRKTFDFYQDARQILENELDNMCLYMACHFRERWGIDRDMYLEAIEANMAYLAHLIRDHGDDYRDKLQRGGIVAGLAGED